MYISQATIKGQVLIPVALRKKYHIQKGSQLAVIDREGEIILKPLLTDPIRQGHGFMKKGPSALKILLEVRKQETKK